MPRIVSPENNTTRVTITVDKKVIDAIRKITKNVSSFFNFAAEQQLCLERKKKFTETLRNFPRKKPIEPTIETIRKGRDEELA